MHKTQHSKLRLARPVDNVNHSMDAYGRLRVGEPEAVFSCKFQYDLQPFHFQTKTSGTGAVAHQGDEATVQLSTGGTASGALAVFQSRRYFNYQPGKSHAVMLTGILGANKANVRSRIGYFDDLNGVFFENDGSDYKVVVRTATSGSAVDTAVDQDDWNIDKMDGTGRSGITLDFSKTQIFFIDMQWLGVGEVRFGVIVGGELYYIHKVDHANSIALPYMQTATLPVRYEIENTGTAASTTTMIAICCVVLSEGGSDRGHAIPFSVSNEETEITVGQGASNRTLLIALRLNQNFPDGGSLVNRVPVQITSFGGIDFAEDVVFEVWWNPTLDGGQTWNAVQGSAVEYSVDETITNVTNGILVGTWYYNSTSGSVAVIDIENDLFLTNNIDGDGHTYIILTAYGRDGSGNGSGVGHISWAESQ